MVGQQLEQELLANFNDYSKWKLFFILTVCDIFVQSRRFEKAFCQADEADI